MGKNSGEKCSICWYEAQKQGLMKTYIKKKKKERRAKVYKASVMGKG